MGIVVEEADESVYWLELIQAAGICKDPRLGPMLGEAGELLAIFNQSQMTAKRNAPQRCGRPPRAPESPDSPRSTNSQFPNKSPSS